MRWLAAAAAVFLFTSSAASARVAMPAGRRPEPQPRAETQRLWTEQSGLFSVRRPVGDLWRFDGGARDAEGTRIPLLAKSAQSGATLSMQSADGVPSPQALVSLLAERLQVESHVHVDDPGPIVARGGDAFGFTFTAGGEQRGRVAVVPAGAHLVLVVASWPLGASPSVVEDVDAMIRSVGPAGP